MVAEGNTSEAITAIQEAREGADADDVDPTLPALLLLTELQLSLTDGNEDRIQVCLTLCQTATNRLQRELPHEPRSLALCRHYTLLHALYQINVGNIALASQSIAPLLQLQNQLSDAPTDTDSWLPPAEAAALVALVAVQCLRPSGKCGPARPVLPLTLLNASLQVVR